MPDRGFVGARDVIGQSGLKELSHRFPDSLVMRMLEVSTSILCCYKLLCLLLRKMLRECLCDQLLHVRRRLLSGLLNLLLRLLHQLLIEIDLPVLSLDEKLLNRNLIFLSYTQERGELLLRRSQS